MAVTKPIVWDKTGERFYETGVDHACLYKYNADTNKYENGVAWNGITNVNETPSGAEASPQYADNIKYVNLISAEEFSATIEAYTYPDEFMACDGSAELATGVYAGQQTRSMFGLSYRTVIGNDTESNEHGYKIHLVYGCQASPSEKGYSTISDSPEAITFSWELNTTPVAIDGMKPTSILTVDSRKVSANALQHLEDALYGTNVSGKNTEATTPYLPLPDEVKTIISSDAA